MEHSREMVVILEWIKLPSEIKKSIQNHPSFCNDIILEHRSEFSPCGKEETWKNTLDENQFRDYYNDQVRTNNYKKSFQEFLHDYGLEIDWWLKDQPIDFTDVKRIFFDICW